MNIPQQTLTYKINTIVYCLLIAFVLITVRLAYLQLIMGESLLVKSKKNYTRTEVIKPPRGDILDCNGIILATNRPTSNLTWKGTGNRTLSKEQLDTLDYVNGLLEELQIQLPTLQRITSAEKKKQHLLLAQDVPLDIIGIFLEQFSNDENIVVTADFKRYYPHKNTGCHILGYLTTNNQESYGKMGIEKLFEDQLKGHYGTLEKHINSFGAHLDQQVRTKAQAGNSIQITLDIELQKKAEAAFDPFYSGALVIMDTEDGSIKALVSRPDFSPGFFLESITPGQWQNLLQKKPFVNRALQACYPPASLFKLVTASAGLEKGLIDPEGRWYCNGYMKFGERRYYCVKRSGHGILTTRECIAHSCNILFFEIGKHISIDTLADYAHRFGLASKTNFILPEKEGLVPTKAWKRTTFNEPWWAGDTLSAAIGQSYLLATPLQMTRLVASISTGYLVKPRLLIEQAIEKEPLRIRPETRKYLQETMKMVVNEGTGRSLKRFTDYMNIEAKTGTAQTADFSKRFLRKENRAHAWFGANIFQENKRPLTLVILVEHAASSQVATSIAKELLKSLS